MAAFLVAITAVTWAAHVPTIEAGARSLRGQQVRSINDAALAQLGLALSTNASSAEAESSVSNMTDALRPVFQALPRSAEDYLEASAVRYLLHRYFIDRDGWFVQGSDASGEAANNSLPEVMLGDSTVAHLLSERLAARGLSLREVAVLATALETLAHDEVVHRLQAAYSLAGLAQRPEYHTEDELSQVLDVYLLLYTLGFGSKETTRKQVDATWKIIYQVHPQWNELRMWAREVRSEVLASIPDQRGVFSGEARVMEELQHRYGRWQDQQCLSIKRALQEHATPGTGRVPLSDFYFAALPGGWKPNESPEYLKHMGALDETDSSSPAVVVPNYFDSPTNCAKVSQYYAVCCISECEALLGHLERKLGSPDALPRQIVDIVERLPSTTVEAPRTLSAQLVARLESVAALHGGHAPLHGRLFRQWMHHAFPSECSFPALSSTKKLLPPGEFTLQTGRPAIADPIDLQRHYQRASKKAMSLAVAEPFTFAVDVSGTSPLRGELPWSDEEELFITCPASPNQAGLPKTRVPLNGIVAVVLLLAVATSLAFVLARARHKSRAPLLSAQSVQ